MSYVVYYKIFIFEFILEDKVIFLDCDFVIKEDIFNFWNIDIFDFYFVVVENFEFD